MALPDNLPVLDGNRWSVRVLYDGVDFCIEEPLTGWWIVVRAWSKSRFEAHVGHLDVIAWRDGTAWMMALPECGGAVRLDDSILTTLLAEAAA